MVVYYYKNFYIKKIKKFKFLKNMIIVNIENVNNFIYFFFEEFFYTFSDLMIFKKILLLNSFNFLKLNHNSFITKFFNLEKIFKYHIFFCIFFLIRDLKFYLNCKLFNDLIINNRNINYINILNKKFRFKELNILRLKLLFCGSNNYLFSITYIIEFFMLYNFFNNIEKLLLTFLYKINYFYFLYLNNIKKKI